MKKISACEKYSEKCKYACCDHREDTSFFLWMYPGEYEKTNLDKKHIEVICFENGAIIGKCKCNDEQKANCNGDGWFKPLDCWSYPFFPFIENGHLVLKVDSFRCPLAKESLLNEQYEQVYAKWSELIKDKTIFECIQRLNHSNYYSNYLNGVTIAT